MWYMHIMEYCAVLCLVAQSCLTLCDPMDCSPPGSSVHGDSPCKNTRVGCHVFLQGIFPTQGLKPGLLHCRHILYHLSYQRSPQWNTEGLPDGSDGKASAYNAGDPGSIPGLGRSPGEGNGNPLQYSCLEKPRDGEAW